MSQGIEVEEYEGETDQRPGTWAELSEGEYRRLVALARRRMVGYEDQADDAVSRAIERWKRLRADPTVARIEQLVKSEAHTIVRSTRRRLERNRRSIDDRSLPSGGHGGSVGPAMLEAERQAIEFWLALKQTAAAEGEEIPQEQREILGLLFCGYSMSDIERDTPLTRHQIKSARANLQRLASRMLLDLETC